MSEKPTKCQWCGSARWAKYCKRGRTMFRCMAKHEQDWGWSIGEVCEIRCVEQLRKLRTLTADDVTPEQVEAVEQSLGIGHRAWHCEDPKKIIAAAVRVMIEGVT